MGMYTQLFFQAELRSDTPKEIIEQLKFLINGEGEDNLSFGKGLRRRDMMFGGNSYYFHHVAHSFFGIRPCMHTYTIDVDCDFKNYDSEAEAFVKWIMPWVDAEEGTFLGFRRYEEFLQPDLIFKEQDK